jgi:hypothetical protein
MSFQQRLVRKKGIYGQRDAKEDSIGDGKKIKTMY